MEFVVAQNCEKAASKGLKSTVSRHFLPAGKKWRTRDTVKTIKYVETAHRCSAPSLLQYFLSRYTIFLRLSFEGAIDTDERNH